MEPLFVDKNQNTFKMESEMNSMGGVWRFVLNGETAAYCWCEAGPYSTWILNDLSVRSENRRLGLGTELVKHVAASLLSLNAKALSCSLSPEDIQNYPNLEQWFADRGFTSVSPGRMRMAF